MGEERLSALLQESLHVAVKIGATKPSDFTRAVVDTTVAEKNIAFPTDSLIRVWINHGARNNMFGIIHGSLV